MYHYEILPTLQRVLNKLSKKDRQLYEQVLGKIEEVITSPDVGHYKNLRHGMKDKKRVHIGHFVLIFKFLKEEDKIVFMDFDHHDKIYRDKKAAFGGKIYRSHSNLTSIQSSATTFFMMYGGGFPGQ